MLLGKIISSSLVPAAVPKKHQLDLEKAPIMKPVSVCAGAYVAVVFIPTQLMPSLVAASQ